MQEDRPKVKDKTRKFPWFRFYNEAIDDPKVQRLTPTLFKTWVNLLCLASQGDGVLPTTDDIAFRLRMSPTDAASQLDELILLGLVDIAPDGARKPHNWNARQFPSDHGDSTAAERMRRYRQRTSRRNDRNAQRNVTAVEESRVDESRGEEKERSGPFLSEWEKQRAKAKAMLDAELRKKVAS